MKNNGHIETSRLGALRGPQLAAVFALTVFAACNNDTASDDRSERTPAVQQDAWSDAELVDQDGDVAEDSDASIAPTQCVTDPCLILRSFQRNGDPDSNSGGFYVVDLANPGEVSPRYNATYPQDERPTPSVAQFTSTYNALIWKQTSADYQRVEVVRVAHDAPGVEVPLFENFTGGHFHRVANSNRMLAAVEKTRGSVLREVFSFVPEPGATLTRLHPELNSDYTYQGFRVAEDTAQVVTHAAHHQEVDGESTLVHKFWRAPIDGSTPAELIDFGREGWHTNQWEISRGDAPQIFALRRKNGVERILDVASLDAPQDLTQIETTTQLDGGIDSAHWAAVPGRLIYYNTTKEHENATPSAVSVTVVDTTNNQRLVDHLALGEGRFKCEIFARAPEKLFCTSLSHDTSFNSVTSMIAFDDPTTVIPLFDGPFGHARIADGFSHIGPQGRYLYFQREVGGSQVINRIDFENPGDIEQVIPAQGQVGQLYRADLSENEEWIVWSLEEISEDAPMGNSQTLYGAKFDALDAPVELARGAEDEPIFGPSFSWTFVAN